MSYDAVLCEHGSYLDERGLPDNVQIVRLDGSVRPFVQEMAGARLVVIPIQRGVMTQSGIAVCLMAMAMGKCVVASYGPGISDVLPAGTAVIVPPGSTDSLRQAVESAWSNPNETNRIAQAGLQYAERLQGTDRLLRDVVDWLRSDFG